MEIAAIPQLVESLIIALLAVANWGQEPLKLRTLGKLSFLALLSSLRHRKGLRFDVIEDLAGGGDKTHSQMASLDA